MVYLSVLFNRHPLSHQLKYVLNFYLQQQQPKKKSNIKPFYDRSFKKSFYGYKEVYNQTNVLLLEIINRFFVDSHS